MEHLPVKTWYIRYRDFIRRTASANTHRRYSDCLENFFSRFPDRKWPEDFHRYDIADYVEARLREGMSPSSVNLEVSTVRTFWNWMKDREIVSFNPASKTKKLRENERLKRALSKDSLDKLLEVCETPEDRLLVLVPLTTGLRGEELARLQWSNIDFDEGLLSLDGDQTKSHKPRIVPIRPDVLELLRQHRTPDSTTVFDRNAQTLRYYFRILTIKAGIPNPGLHALRHTYATMLVRAGVDIFTVKDLLGHADVKTTCVYLRSQGAAAIKDTLAVFPA